MKKACSYILILIAWLLSNPVFSKDERDPDFGAVEFERSCAVCHGFKGKGNGVMADILKVKPSDLTQLTKKNHGHFPFTEVYREIDGSSAVGIHGSRDMPIWGNRYREDAKHHGFDEYIYTRGIILGSV